jgi:hypothetical protein
MSQLLLEKVESPAPAPLSVMDEPFIGRSARIHRARKKKNALSKASKHTMHWIRRGHLYFGLFLFPWAVLYGVTAFLFNHPTAFSDQKVMSFNRSHYSNGAQDVGLETPSELSADLVAKLNAAQKPSTPYQIGTGESRFTREFAFATFKSGKNNYNLLLDLNNGSGTIREQATPRQTEEREPPVRAPFAIGDSLEPPGRRSVAGDRVANGRPGGRRGGGQQATGIETVLKSQVESVIPKICKSMGLECNEMVITSIPELSLPIKAGDEEWLASYNPLSGFVSGRKAGEEVKTEITWRRFLLRLHTAHGYPSSGWVRWFWAVIVDVMAGVMCFWGFSGILMWWQIKSTRVVGILTVILGFAAATGLGVGMHFAMR